MAPITMHPDKAAQVLDAFAHAAQGNDTSSSVVFRNGRMEQTGRLGAFFTGQATHRATIDNLRSAILTLYGPDVANIAEARLEHLQAQGKPLRACVVRDLLRDVEAGKQEVARMNSTLVQQFTGDNPLFGGATLTPAMDAFFAGKNWTEGQKVECRQLTQDYLAQGPGHGGKEFFTPDKLFQQISSGELPCLAAYRAAVDHTPDRSYRDVMERVPPQLAKDMSYMRSMFCDNRTDMGTVALMLEKLPTMRAAQPQGPLSPATIWNACTNGAPMPEELGADPQKLGSTVSNFMRDQMELAAQDRPDVPVLVLLSMCAGMRHDVAAQLALQPGPIGLHDLVSTAPLYALTPHVTLDAAEAQLGADLHRMGQEDGVHSTFSFTTPQGQHNIDVNDDTHMDAADKARYAGGNPNAMTRDIREQVVALCGEGNPGQAQVVMFGMSQAGLALVRNLSFMTGAPRSEHCAMNISLHREDNGDIRMEFRRPPGTPFDCEMDYVVHPDGTSELTHLQMSGNP